jgi:hypothetical protein
MGRWSLGNGFSDTYDICKSKGDFLWIETTRDSEDIIELPFKTGTAYVSCCMGNQLVRVWKTALQNPEIEFVCGGPGLIGVEVIDDLPTNMKLTYNSVEWYFGYPDFSGKWKLSLPDAIQPGDKLYFTYGIDGNQCYWNKCSYCNRPSWQGQRKRKIIDLELDDHFQDYNKLIRIGTEALQPKDIYLLNQLPDFPNLWCYKLNFRFNKKSVQNFKEVATELSTPFVGGASFEFPTDRMWKIMNKGYTTDEVIECLNILNDTDMSIITGGFMLGWNCLIDQDIDDLRQFFQRLPAFRNKKLVMFVWPLYVFPGSLIDGKYDIDHKVIKGPFYFGYVPTISPEQETLNDRALEVIEEYSNVDNIEIHKEWIKSWKVFD